jgi:RNA polymerase sigma-70 factor (ECF subfamily)
MSATHDNANLEVQLVQSLPFAFRSALSVLQNHADAEDVSHDALIRAYRCLPQLRQPDRLRPWLSSISRRLALNKLQSERRKTTQVVAVADHHIQPTAMDALLIRERSRRLWTAIEALPQHLRSVTILVEIEERTIHEVASSLRVPKGTVKSRLFRARQRLKELLE